MRSSCKRTASLGTVLGMCCGLLVTAYSGAAFATTGTVAPGTITHSQRVNVTWSGLAAGQSVFVQQCDNVITTNPAAFDESIDCSGLTQQNIDGQTFNASGSGSTGTNLATNPDFNAFVGVEPSGSLGWGCGPTGSPSGTPDGSGNLIYNPCQIRVSDSSPAFPINQFVLTLNFTPPSGTLPVFTTDSPPTSVVAGSPFSYTFAASGSPAPTFNWVNGSAASFLSLNGSTGQLAGTPTLPGSYTFQVQADNTAGGTRSAFHTLTVLTPSSGAVLAGGDNSFGQLCNGTTVNSSTAGAAMAPANASVTQVAAGAYFSLALRSDGSVLACGRNNFGQLGNGTTTDSSTPVAVALPGGVSITAVAADGYQGLALASSGVVYAWGYNAFGQLGDGTTTNRSAPVLVNLPGGTTVASIAAGWSYGLALTSAGTVLSWGWNAEGELGDGTGVQHLTPVSVLAPATGVTAIAAGSNHNLALRSDGTIVGWGLNNFGQVGDGTTVNRFAPVVVALPGGPSAIAVSTGGGHSLALRSDGTVLSWGWNSNGELGDGTTTTRTSPVAVHLPAGTAISALASGFHHSLAQTTSGALYAWGANASGQLLNGATVDRATPVLASAPANTGVISVSAGWAFSILVKP